jgi:hypothetical protein
VNMSSFDQVSLLAENLAVRAAKYGLPKIAETASEIEKAATKNRDQMELVQLTSNLLQLCGSPGKKQSAGADEVQQTMVA